MKVLVTGATGFLGRYLIKKLIKKKGISILAIVRPFTDTKYLKNENVEVLRCNLADKNGLKDTLKEIDELDVVFHLAAELGGSHYEMVMNTVVATDNLLIALENCTIKRFVLLSTLSAYKMTGLAKNAVLDENTPVEDQLSLRESYCITKIKQERITRVHCEKFNIPLLILRPGKVYGPTADIIPTQVGLRFPGLFFLMMGGNHILPLTHVSNCADAIFMAGIVKNIGSGFIINIFDDDLPTQRGFIRLYKKYFKSIPRLIWVPYFVFRWIVFLLEKSSKISKGNIPPIITRYRADSYWKPFKYSNSMAKRTLGWSPKISVEDGLNETFLHAKEFENRHSV